MSSPLWMIIHAFGSAALPEALSNADMQVEVPAPEIQSIAGRSTLRYFTDGKRLWADPASSASDISAREAFDRFGLQRLYEAREYGSS